MTLRTLLWLAVLFAIAVALAVLGQHDPGHVMILWPPYRVDLSLNLAIGLMVLAVIVFYVVVRALRAVLKLPQRVSVYRQRSRAERSRGALREAIAHLFAGRFARAEKAARDAAAQPENRDAAGLIGAQAAHRMREYARRDVWLESIVDPDWAEARQLANADMLVDARDPAAALTVLGDITSRGRAAKRIHAQLIALRAHQQLRQWNEVAQLARTLEKRDAVTPSHAEHLRRTAGEHLIREQRHDGDAILRTWSALRESDRYWPRIADLTARSLVDLNRHADARRIVEEALSRQWDPQLVRRYGECAGSDPLPLIQRAEAWQLQHPNDADLSYALGMLCIEQKLWGKAQRFFDAALSQSDDELLTQRVHRAAARMHEALGRLDAAGEHYRASALTARIDEDPFR